MRDMLFIKANAHIPMGKITSTVRRGSKWASYVQAGDVVQCIECNNAHDGKCGPECRVMFRAAVTAVHLINLDNVLAHHSLTNHECVSHGITHFGPAGTEVLQGLERAYGKELSVDFYAYYTVVYLLPLREV